MWTANRSNSVRTQRTSSVHSIGSVESAGRSPSTMSNTRSSTYGNDNQIPPVWQTQRQQPGPPPQRKMPEPPKVQKVTAPNLAKLEKRTPWERIAAGEDVPGFDGKPDTRTPWEKLADGEDIPDDDATSQSSTLDGHEEVDLTQLKKNVQSVPRMRSIREEPRSPLPAPHVPGPLESALGALMSKLIYLEHANPAIAVSPEDYKEMQQRLKALEAEKKTWSKRHEAIWALRDEDVENNIKIRGMLAKARRELEGMTKLRDEDLINVQVVRSKLAEKTRELERLQAQGGRISPHRGRPGSFERRDTSDLFAAAKTAALEQRALELEKRNSDLVKQIEALKGGANIEDLNRLTAHQAWRDTVSGLESQLKAKDSEIARLKQTQPASSGSSMDWNRLESLFEEHANYRELVGGRLQALRSEKEALQRDFHSKENECLALELKVQTLTRRTAMLSV